LIDSDNLTYFMRLPIPSLNLHVKSAKMALSVASSPEEIREVQRLRYKVLAKSVGLSQLANPDGLDEDEIDAWCDHLIVRDMRTLNVVGTFRVLSPRAAVCCGHFHAEQAFDLERLQHLRGQMAEAGCACVHPDYRASGVLMMLWAGLSALMRREGCDYLASCASISLADGGYNATALYQRLGATHLSPLEYRVAPRNPLVLHKCEPGHAPYVPPLLEGYLRGGAWICGEPAWDADSNSAELFLLLPIDAMYRRRLDDSAMA
jgi:putative hemolysin